MEDNNTATDPLLKTAIASTGWAGFAGAWTWGNIGTQVANGIISGGTGWVIGKFFDEISVYVREVTY